MLSFPRKVSLASRLTQKLASECELLDRSRFLTRAVARPAVFDLIEGWCNPRRRHSALAYLSPMMFEQTHVKGDRSVSSGPTIDQGDAISVSPSGVVQ